MTTTNTNVAANPVLTNALQAALQGKTDLFSMIDGSKGFSALLQQFDVDQADAAQAQADAKSGRSQADDDQTMPDSGDAALQNKPNPSSRVVAKDDSSKKTDARKKDDAKTDDDVRVEDRARVSDAAVSADTADVEEVTELTTIITTDTPQTDEETGEVPVVQVNDVVASQARVPESVGLQVLPHQAQHAVKEQVDGDIVESASGNMPTTIVPDAPTPLASSPNASGEEQSSGRKNHMQSAMINGDTGLQDTAPVGEAPVDPTLKAKPEATSEQESVLESTDMPVARDQKSSGGMSPSLMTLVAVPKPVEASASSAAQHSGNAAKIDSSGVRSYESTGKLTQGYDQAAQLTAPKSARSTTANAAQVIEQVTVKLNQQAKNGLDQMTIQLRPADLGRVDIKLNFQDGAVTALIIAESQTTLDILAKDSRSLERALQDAGLRADPGSLSFQLRDPGGHATPQDERRAGGSTHNFEASESLLAEAADDEDVAIIELNRVNIRV